MFFFKAHTKRRALTILWILGMHSNKPQYILLVSNRHYSHKSYSSSSPQCFQQTLFNAKIECADVKCSGHDLGFISKSVTAIERPPSQPPTGAGSIQWAWEFCSWKAVK